MNVDALGVHVDQTLRVAERDVARQVPLGRCRQGRILHQVPDVRHKRVGVNVHGLDATTADDDLAPLARRGTYLHRCESLSDASPCDDHSGRNARNVFQKGSAIAHCLLLGPSRVGSAVQADPKSEER